MFPSLGPNCSWFIMSLSHCCPGPPGLSSNGNARGLCQSPVQRPSSLIPSVKIVFWMSEIGPGFKSVHMRSHRTLEAPFGPLHAADMGLMVPRWICPYSNRTRHEELGTDTSYTVTCYQLFVMFPWRGFKCSHYVTNESELFHLLQRHLSKAEPVSTFYCLIWILVIYEEVKMKMNRESQLLQILSYSYIHKTIAICKCLVFP